MPLRDHFRPPIWNKSSWEGFHGMWPAVIVQKLVPLLPEDFTAEPRAHLGSYYEIDVSAYEEDEPRDFRSVSESTTGGLATATYTPLQPTFVVDADLDEQYAYEVLIYDHSRNRQLVAAIEIVSPANKDRPENRRALVAKCSALLHQNVCVSLVDLVTARRFNLYGELLESIGHKDPQFSARAPAIYAVTCRYRKIDEKPRFESWAYPLVVGQALPALPIWLTEDLHVSLDLEASYEETCRVLRLV